MKLLVKHPYYCSDSNWYSGEPSQSYVTFADFYEEWHDADEDMNLIFRFDVRQREESGRYYAEVFMMLQRKGIFKPIHISYLDEGDEELMTKLLARHWQKLVEMWAPISGAVGVPYESEERE